MFSMLTLILWQQENSREWERKKEKEKKKGKGKGLKSSMLRMCELPQKMVMIDLIMTRT